MKWKNLFKVSFRSILKNRMRSFLTSLGIIIGVSAVIVMVAVGEGSQTRIKNQISSLGSNLILIRPGSRDFGGINQGTGSFNRLTLEDAEKLSAEATLASAVSPVVQARAQVVGGDGNWNTSIQGVGANFLTVKDWPLSSGEFFTERDVQSKSKVAVLGQDVVNALFPDRDPIGQQIRINNTPFRVIGVLSMKGQTAMGTSQDDIIMSPSTTVLFRLSGGRYISSIYASAVSTDKIPAAQEELRGLLRKAHRLKQGEDDDFIVRNQTEIIDAASQISVVLTMLLGAVAGVSLVVGGIGIMNIMLVSVTERTREIGIRLAVGARGRDVMIQFLTEAVLLSLVGGIIGMALAVLVSYGLKQFFDIFTALSWGVAFLAFAFSGAVGIFFGLYPARKAASLNPIDALRYE
jgi:putative ABC transport system permease protein